MKLKSSYLAFKFKDNFLAKLLFKRLWRFYCKIFIEKPAYNKKNKFYKKNAILVLSKAKEALDSANVFFWLDFGTLLGAYREHDFIEHDFDIDLGVFIEDKHNVKKLLESYGFQLKKEYVVENDENGLEQTYMYKSVYVDVFYYVKNRDSMFCYGFSNLRDVYFDEELITSKVAVEQIVVPNEGFRILEFKEMMFNVPNPTEKYLIANYGPDFMLPNPNFNYKNDASNVRYFKPEDKVGIYTRFI